MGAYGFAGSQRESKNMWRMQTTDQRRVLVGVECVYGFESVDGGVRV